MLVKNAIACPTVTTGTGRSGGYVDYRNKAATGEEKIFAHFIRIPSRPGTWLALYDTIAELPCHSINIA